MVLADEPTGNLDSTATLEVLRLFEALHEGGLTLVVVTHDERIAATADRLISMRDGAFVDGTRLTGGHEWRPLGLRRIAERVMGHAFLVWRLAARDVRHHLAQALLLMVAIAAASAALTMALALNGVTNQPYLQTRAVTKGPDVVVYLTAPSEAAPGAPTPPGPTVRTSSGAPASIDYSVEARALIHSHGVVASSGPYPLIGAVAAFRRPHRRSRGRRAPADLGSRLTEPKLTAGAWVRPGGVVLERTFAEALGVGVGSRITLSGMPFTVTGIAVTAAQSPYPNLCYDGDFGCVVRSFDHSSSTESGLETRDSSGWTSRSWHLLASRSNPIENYVVNLKLRDPADARGVREPTAVPGDVVGATCSSRGSARPGRAVGAHSRFGPPRSARDRERCRCSSVGGFPSTPDASGC